MSFNVNFQKIRSGCTFLNSMYSFIFLSVWILINLVVKHNRKKGIYGSIFDSCWSLIWLNFYLIWWIFEELMSILLDFRTFIISNKYSYAYIMIHLDIWTLIISLILVWSNELKYFERLNWSVHFLKAFTIFTLQCTAAVIWQIVER